MGKKNIYKPYDNYRYIIKNNKEIIALSTYAGKTVKGIAKCDPRDEFDIEKGKKLAAARCNAKVANKRYRRAEKELAIAQKNLERARKFYLDKLNYFEDAQCSVANAEGHVLTLKFNYNYDK